MFSIVFLVTGVTAAIIVLTTGELWVIPPIAIALFVTWLAKEKVK
jgi:hypothetical protein